MTFLLLIIDVTVTSIFDYAGDIAMTVLPPLVSKMPKDTLSVITGNMLGDGCLRPSAKKRDGIPRGNVRFEMNKCTASLTHHYAMFLKYYKVYSGVGFRENTYFHGQLKMMVTQWHIFTLSSPMFTQLHSL